MSFEDADSQSCTYSVPRDQCDRGGAVELCGPVIQPFDGDRRSLLRRRGPGVPDLEHKPGRDLVRADDTGRSELPAGLRPGVERIVDGANHRESLSAEGCGGILQIDIAGVEENQPEIEGEAVAGAGGQPRPELVDEGQRSRDVGFEVGLDGTKVDKRTPAFPQVLQPLVEAEPANGGGHGQRGCPGSDGRVVIGVAIPPSILDRMVGALFLLLLAVPAIELWIIIRVAGELGLGTTLVLLVVISVAGAWLLKQQGLQTWRRLQSTLSRGRMPTAEVTDGALILLGGALLMTPGFLTDAFGIVLLLPPARAVVKGAARGAMGRWAARRLRRGPSGGPAGGASQPGSSRRPPVIDVTEVDRPPPNRRAEDDSRDRG